MGKIIKPHFYFLQSIARRSLLWFHWNWIFCFW